jgi:ABC-type transport system involved in cytochrome c biogenesis ATPase subunit
LAASVRRDGGKGCLPGVFTSINENFILAAIEGMPVMAEETGSVDLDTLQTSATEKDFGFLILYFSHGTEKEINRGKYLAASENMKFWNRSFGATLMLVTWTRSQQILN